MACSNQFIGSKISLISKSEIRYEGILYSLDLQEATISLARVRSYGTEDRPTERPVPPKDEVYEFIIFRGTDIKGIDVLEPPKQSSTVTSGLPNDPAIVEVSHYHGSQGLPGVPQPQVPGPGLIGSSKPSPQNNSELNNSATSIEHAGGISAPVVETASTHDTSRSNASTPSAFGSSRRSPTNDVGAQISQQNRGNRPPKQQNNRRGGRGGGAAVPQDNRRGSNDRQGGYNNRYGYQNRGRGNFNRGGPRNNNMIRGNNRGRTQGMMVAQKPARVKFDDPFDFEKSNEEMQAQLQKLKVSDKDETERKEEATNEVPEGNQEQEEQENKEPTVFYSKDNFFDNISCEALERSKGNISKPDWKAERKLNAETFGIPAGGNNRRNNYRGGNYRGNYRGYGGRGGYSQRGFGGYNSYNYRYNGGSGGRGRGNATQNY